MEMSTQTGPDAIPAYVQVLDDFPMQARVPMLYPILCRAPVSSAWLYLSLATLESEQAVDALSKHLFPPLALFAIAFLRELRSLTEVQNLKGGHGFEIFSTVATTESLSSAGYLHVDNDEDMRLRHNTLRTPLLGSILHVGPREGLVGGETIFLTQDLPARSQVPLFRKHEWEELVRLDGATVVSQRAGRLILFDGRLPHAVAPILAHPPDQPRVTFLANLWDRPISSGHSL
jgi:hypothetical protein